MNDVAADGATESAHAFERETLCFAKTEVGSVLRNGDEGYRERLQSLYSGAESIASDRLVKLKQRLRTAMGDEFWELLAEGVATISGAQYSFVSKRMITDDENLAVEMPPIGEPGSCLNAVAFYFNDGHGSEIRLRNMKYHAYSCPCAYMKHDKILIIPEGVSTLIPDNPNGLKVPVESYLGVPLFAEGKCFGHFGVMWSAEGIAKKKLGWAFLEMTFHALEDMILDRILNQPNFADGMMHNSQKPNRVVPHDAISVAQSLKPYARSLSHELRTPMQGVVGMLDVMHANVQEAAEDQKDPQVRKVFKELKENIEVVQDSARRAVEAADNVVHAYDMNMGVPEVPLVTNSKDMSDIRRRSISLKDNRPEIVVTGNNLAFNLRSGKRRRQSVQWANGKNPKRHRSDSEWSGRYPSTNDIESNPAKAAVNLMDAMAVAQATHSPDRMNCTTDSPPYSSERTVVPGLRHTSLHDVLRYIINDSLKVGGRPESAIAQETERGEVIEVMTRSPKGEEKTKVIEWSVDPLVPDSILIDERDLSKMVSCVVLNALKFTEEGKISILAKLSLRSRYITINVRDTGSGIPAAFLPNLFKAFSREDDSLTRQSEGLGLGLLVARGLSRKMGGDLFCVRSETSGPHKGTDFEIRVPLTPGEVCSRSGSPHSSPTPSMRSRHSHSADMDRGSTERGRSRHTPTPMIDHSKDMLRDHRIPYPTPAQISGTTPLAVPSPLPTSSPARRYSTPNRRVQKTPSDIDRNLARRHPLNILVAEDNKINRKLLVNMLRRLGYNKVREAYDGADAVRQWSIDRENGREIDVVLMDLWMPYMDGYEATEKILGMAADDDMDGTPSKIPTILAVTADVTDGALERAAKAGMKGFMTKPYKLIDLEKLIVEYCATRAHEDLL